MKDTGVPGKGELIAGKYRVTRVLGQGGMGCVVAAHHELLNQEVAIKFLLPEAAADEQFVTRFLREAQTAATIRSEHVVRVLDVGKTDEGAPYMVMELLAGVDLGDRVDREGPLPITDAVDYILQACEALAEAHAAGLVHRDIKPSNLFLARRSDGSPLVKLLDFGIAKAPSATSGKLTATGVTMGSPAYMSPEQMRDFKAVDARSDVWSLGATLYELLAGSPPFIAETYAALCVVIATEPPARLRDVRPDAPAGLEAVLLRCLEKRPADRIPDVAALARELQPFASPHAEVSVARIHRLLGAEPSNPRLSVPRISVTPSVTPAASPFSRTVAATSTDLTTSPGASPAPPRRMPALWIGLAAGIGAGLLAVVLALQGRGPDASADPEAKIGAPSAAPSIEPTPAGPASAPKVVPAPSADAAPSAPPATPATTTTAGPARPTGTTTAKPTPPVRPTGTKHADPFADQH